MGGKTLNLENDAEILQIKVFKKSGVGPYLVVYKNIKDRWAIVAMDWFIGNKAEPRLGIRWFNQNVGNPQSSSKPSWLVIPPEMSKNILFGLPIEHDFYGKIAHYTTVFNL